MQDKVTAQEFIAEFGLEVSSLSKVACGSLRNANKLLEIFGYRQTYNHYYQWEMGQRMATTYEDGSVTFHRRATPQEKQEKQKRREAWLEEEKVRQESKQQKKHWWTK